MTTSCIERQGRQPKQVTDALVETGASASAGQQTAITLAARVVTVPSSNSSGQQLQAIERPIRASTQSARLSTVETCISTKSIFAAEMSTTPSKYVPTGLRMETRSKRLNGMFGDGYQVAAVFGGPIVVGTALSFFGPMGLLAAVPVFGPMAMQLARFLINGSRTERLVAKMKDRIENNPDDLDARVARAELSLFPAVRDHGLVSIGASGRGHPFALEALRDIAHVLKADPDAATDAGRRAQQLQRGLGAGADYWLTN